MSGREIKATREIMAAAWNRRRPRRREGLLARSPTLIGVFVRIIAFAMLISLAVAPRSTAAAPNQVKTVVLLGVQFLNDHQDQEPTTDAERTRLASIERLFKSKLEASGRYRFVPIPAEAAAKIAAGPEIGSCGGCELDYGKRLGADLAAWIVVQKVSDLILNVNAYMADVVVKKLTFVHSVDIRSNTVETWARGMNYLLNNYILVDLL